MTATSRRPWPRSPIVGSWSARVRLPVPICAVAAQKADDTLRQSAVSSELEMHLCVDTRGSRTNTPHPEQGGYNSRDHRSHRRGTGWRMINDNGMFWTRVLVTRADAATAHNVPSDP